MAAPSNAANVEAGRRVRALLQRVEPRLRRQVEQALRGLQASVAISRLEQILTRRDAFGVHDLAGTLPRRLRPAARTLEHVFFDGAQVGVAALPPPLRIGFRFDSRNPDAQQAARTRAAALVTDITTTTRQAIRQIVARSFSDGLPPREAARLIKPLIGLTARQASAAATRMEVLLDNGLSRAAAKMRTIAYADQLLAKRALTIARTEIIRASADGQMASWDAAARSGKLTPTARKVFIVTPDDRLCPICAPLDGQTTTLGGKFRTRLGMQIEGPPIHPNCRCAVAVRPGPPVRATSAPLSSVPAAPPARLRMRPQPPEAPPDTLATYRRADGTWTPERQKLHDKLMRSAQRGIPKSKNPTVYMTGGGPASGKSSMLSAGRVTYPSPAQAIHVDADSFKKQLPEFVAKTKAGDVTAATFVHEESSYLAKRVASQGAQRGRDLVLDTTGDGTIESLTERLNGLRSNGHRVVANYATNDTDKAVTFARLRGEKKGPNQGRFVPENYIREIHAEVSRTLPKAVEHGLFDEVNLWDTNVLNQPRLVMSGGRGRPMVIHDEALWQDFLAKGAR